MNVTLKCENCKNEFITEFKHRDKKFCSRDCYFVYARNHKLLGKEKDPNVREERTCIECGNIFIERKKYERKLCSDECRKIWNEKNNEFRINKSKESLIEKHGVDSLFKKKEFQLNVKKQFLKKYGVSHPMEKKEFVDKLKNTIRKNHIPKLIERLEKNNIVLLDEYINNKEGHTSRTYNFQCIKCDNVFSSTLLGSGKTPICRKCYPITKNSKVETIIKDFLNDNNITHIDSDRKILNGKEIDILLPDYNIGLEINGNYYHSEIHGEKERNYHINKTIESNNKNIRLIHIFEDEIINKKEITLSRLKNLLGLTENKIFARKCELRIVDKKTSTIFLENNHIQGDSIDKIRIGLYYRDELVSLMTFGNKRKVLGNKTKDIQQYELVRFCNKINTNVVGSFSKLLKNFIKTHNPKSITTYADIRWSGITSKNTVYQKNGFNYVDKTPPNYWYVSIDDFINRYHRFNFRKDTLIKEGNDENKSEWEIMQEKKYDRIWDCGSMKFELYL